MGNQATERAMNTNDDLLLEEERRRNTGTTGGQEVVNIEIGTLTKGTPRGDNPESTEANQILEDNHRQTDGGNAISRILRSRKRQKTNLRND
jgi:hypothetical protein